MTDEQFKKLMDHLNNEADCADSRHGFFVIVFALLVPAVIGIFAFTLIAVLR